MHVLALDIGTSSARALVFDERGEPVPGAGAQARYTSTRGHSGRLGEFDADELLAVTRKAMDEARRDVGGDVDAVAISSFWHSLVPVDAGGRPLGPVLTWRHLETTAPVPLDSDDVHARTGCPLHPSFWPLKIAGLHASGVRAARYLSFSDLLTEGRTSLSMASGTGLLGLDGHWDTELLEVLELDEVQLPELADELVVGDGAAANVGSGALGRRRAALTLGTSGALRTITSRAFRAPASSSTGSMPSACAREARFPTAGICSTGSRAYLAAPRRQDLPTTRLRRSTSWPSWAASGAPAGTPTPAVRSPDCRSRPARATSCGPRSRESPTGSPKSSSGCRRWRNWWAAGEHCATTPTGLRFWPTCSSGR